MEILFCLFTCILIMAGVSLYVSLRIGNKTQFDRVTHFLLFYIIIHVFHAFVVRLLPNEYMYVDKAAPFGLLYGPLVYYAYLASGYGLNRKTILIHATPFIIALPIYISFMVIPSFRLYLTPYYQLLYGLMALSWIFYSVYVGYKGTVKKESEHFGKKEHPSVIAVILFIITVFMVLVILIRSFEDIHAELQSDVLILFMGMLAIVFYIFLFTIQNLTDKINFLESQVVVNTVADDGDEAPIYVKSGMQAANIEVHAERVSDYLLLRKYLDPKFNLNTLSSDLKIPKHHLSQLFNQYYGQSFLKYINSLRIMHACELLENLDLESNIEDLADRCGFNSKASFYRNFREIAKMTPSEFLNRSKKINTK